MTDLHVRHVSDTDFLQLDAIRSAVRETYRSVGPTDRRVAERFYSPDELAGLPDETIRSALGVGNPVRNAGLRPGDDVLDLGSGGGIDCLIAARCVAPGGSVVGIDFLAEKVDRATRSAAEAGLLNVRFVESEIEALPLPDASVDVVISNGVINLSPRKVRVLAEAFRVLRPGGRLAIVDLVLDHDLPPEIQTHPAAWAGCLSGALSEIALYKGLRRAGFRDVAIEPLDDFGIAECALYPLFNDTLLDLLRHLVPAERQERIAAERNGPRPEARSERGTARTRPRLRRAPRSGIRRRSASSYPVASSPPGGGPVTVVGPAPVDIEALRAAIRAEYAAVAEHPGQGFHFHTGARLAAILGYPEEWIAALPPTVVESMAGTGNPFALGELRAGERIVDCGSGAGVDSLIAAGLVAPDGSVIGIDKTPEMLAKARRNAELAGVRNVEFREGVLEALPVPDGWADVVISNGVLNLVPDKAVALAEIFRVLRPDGRIQLADIVLDRPVPAGSKADVSLWTGCIAGGLLEDEFVSLVAGAGFRDVEVRRGVDVFGGAPQHSDATAFGTVGAGIVGRKP